MESAAGAIIIFQGSMRTSAQNTKACIGQNAGCMYSSSFHCNARQAKVFHFRQIIVPDFGFYADIAVKGAGVGISADLALRLAWRSDRCARPVITHIPEGDPISFTLTL
jgi:hypothetical protein